MADNNPSPTTLKQYLKTASKEDLIKDISELYKKFSTVKDYYKVKFSPAEDVEVIGKYKKIIQDEFFPQRGYGKARLSVAKKAVSEYKKVSTNPTNLIDIMLFYVEQGVKFTKAYGDINEAFYYSMESMYENLVKEIVKHKMEDIFQQRCLKIVTGTEDMGWGFYDTLYDIYEDVFAKDKDQ